MTTIREWAEVEFRDLEQVTIVEIGAHKGEDTAWLCRINPRAEVHAFEPDPIRRMSKLPGVTWHPLAVCDEAHAVRPWWRSTTRDGVRSFRASSSLLRPTLHLERHPEVRFEDRIISCTTLDEFARRHLARDQRVDLMWWDAQGAERLIIEGGRDLLRRTSWLYTEATVEALYEGAPTRAEILAMLPEWRVEQEWPNDVLLRRTA